MRGLSAGAVLVVVGAILSAARARADERTEHVVRPGHDLLEDRSESLSVAVGESVPKLAFRDGAGDAVYVDRLLEKGPVVLVFTSTRCPLAKRYIERLKRLHETYNEKGVRIIALFPNDDETVEGVRDYVAAAKFPFVACRDVEGYVARRVGATMTPQAFVIDGARQLRYRGAIDDHRYAERVGETYLADALDAVLGERAVEVSSTKALGCALHLGEAPGAGEVVYTTHVARILQDKCQSCHRPGEVGPFALTSYEEARRWKREIRAYTAKRLMPPWKAAPGVGEFANDTSLSDAEIDILARWVEADAPRGPEEDAPPAPEYAEGWAYGEPDLIVEMPEEYVVGPEGEDDYRHFIVPYDHGEHRFVEAIDVRPGNRSVVHHVIAYVDTSGKARELDAKDPGPGYTRFGGVGFDAASVLGGWAPGKLPEKSPPATGHWLPPKGDIVLQVHYYRTGVEERDRTKVGLYFSKDERPVAVRGGMVINHEFVVPPGEERHEVRASLRVGEDVYAFSVTPHMHLIGETMDVRATLPDDTVVPLIRIDDWDFNWQSTYHYRDFVFLPRGTRIDLVATFDNSADNPNNPNDPPAPIGWGERTTDEMCIAFIDWLRASEYDPERKARRAVD